MLVETYDKHCDSDLHTLRYYLSDDMSKDTRPFRRLSVLNSSPYQYFNVLTDFQIYIPIIESENTVIIQFVLYSYVVVVGIARLCTFESDE